MDENGTRHHAAPSDSNNRQVEGETEDRVESRSEKHFSILADSIKLMGTGACSVTQHPLNTYPENDLHDSPVPTTNTRGVSHPHRSTSDCLSGDRALVAGRRAEGP